MAIPANAVSVRELNTSNIASLPQVFLAGLSPDALVPTNIKVFGTKYEAGMVLVLEKEDSGEMKVGILKAISFYKEEVIFGCGVFKALHSKHGFYVTTNQVSDLQIFNHKGLADYHPLQRIGTSDKFCFSLHNFVSEAKPS